MIPFTVWRQRELEVDFIVLAFLDRSQESTLLGGRAARILGAAALPSGRVERIAAKDLVVYAHLAGGCLPLVLGLGHGQSCLAG